MSKIAKVIKGIGWCVIMILTLLAISVFGTLYGRAMGWCMSYESICIDFTNGNWQGIELPKEICRDGKSCETYCQSTYGVPMLWQTCCLTDGEVPDSSGHCINTQACRCDMGELP